MDAENIINSDDIDLNNHREEISSALDSIASWADLVSSLTRGIIDSDNDREREVLARSIESTISILGATADDLNQRILTGMPFKESIQHWLADIAPHYRKIASGNESTWPAAESRTAPLPGIAAGKPRRGLSPRARTNASA